MVCDGEHVRCVRCFSNGRWQSQWSSIYAPRVCQTVAIVCFSCSYAPWQRVARLAPRVAERAAGRCNTGHQIVSLTKSVLIPLPDHGHRHWPPLFSLPATHLGLWWPGAISTHKTNPCSSSSGSKLCHHFMRPDATIVTYTNPGWINEADFNATPKAVIAYWGNRAADISTPDPHNRT